MPPGLKGLARVGQGRRFCNICSIYTAILSRVGKKTREKSGEDERRSKTAVKVERSLHANSIILSKYYLAVVAVIDER